MDRGISFSGGAIIALAIFTGTAVGTTRGFPSYGLIIGAAIGSTIALLIWIRDWMRTP